MSQAVSDNLPPVRVSIAEYLRRADASPEKLEYYNGEIVAMAGTTPNHAIISMNIRGELRNRIRGKSCQPFGSDLRISVPSMPSFSYPDLSVVCGPLQFDPRDRSNRTVINPRVLIEILSSSTERFDRGRKFKRYIKLESLEEYVLVSQEEARVESFLRKNDGTWAFSFVEGAEAQLPVQSLQLQIPLSEVYRNVVFPPLEPDEALIEPDAR